MLMASDVESVVTLTGTRGTVSSRSQRDVGYLRVCECTLQQLLQYCQVVSELF